ncbi:Ochratoxin highly reducing polyketide synthase ota1 [Metarhizium anisopliae]|nr:Ochratoxin highly reducing polyketide synthase ota1 [Metarhizium anisopliae]
MYTSVAEIYLFCIAMPANQGELAAKLKFFSCKTTASFLPCIARVTAQQRLLDICILLGFISKLLAMGSASRNEDMYEPIAIIGLACRYGGDVKNSSELLRHVMKAKSVYGAVPEGRLDARHLYHPATGHIGSIYSNGGYFLKDDINNFDSAFFQLPENDVVAMDPQQKMLLESVYHALENAGMSMKEIACTTTSVYVGCSNNDSLAIANSDLLSTLQCTSTGTSPSILSNRISWFYDLRGTSQTIDTACSSSLVAFHQACQSIQHGHSMVSINCGSKAISIPYWLILP